MHLISKIKGEKPEICTHSEFMSELRSLSARDANSTEMTDAAVIMCASLCYASDCNTLVTTSSTTSFTL